MPNKKALLGWVVFYCSLGAYVPLMIGGWQHPSEMNVACFSIWILLSGVLTWASRRQSHDGWKLLLADMVGNIFYVVMALVRGGYTFNIGDPEAIGLYGTCTVLCTWFVYGKITSKWSDRILYLGCLGVDVASFYPQFKQYLLPHEKPTDLMIIAWIMFGIAAFMNFALVDRLPKKLRVAGRIMRRRPNLGMIRLFIVEKSLFSIENFIMITIAVILMLH